MEISIWKCLYFLLRSSETESIFLRMNWSSHFFGIVPNTPSHATNKGMHFQSKFRSICYSSFIHFCCLVCYSAAAIIRQNLTRVWLRVTEISFNPLLSDSNVNKTSPRIQDGMDYSRWNYSVALSHFVYKQRQWPKLAFELVRKL